MIFQSVPQPAILNQRLSVRPLFSDKVMVYYRWLRHRLKNYNEQNFIIIAILIMIAAHLSFLLLLSFLFLFLL